MILGKNSYVKILINILELLIWGLGVLRLQHETHDNTQKILKSLFLF